MLHDYLAGQSIWEKVGNFEYRKGECLVGHQKILRMLMKGKFDVYEKWNGGDGHSRSQLSTYIEIFSPKKTGFSPVKNTSQIFFDFFLPLFYGTF